MGITLKQQSPAIQTQDPVEIELKELFDKKLTIDELLVWTTEHNCSDLYIKESEQPYISKFGKIYMVDCDPITENIWQIFYDKYLTNEAQTKYVTDRLYDTSVAIRIPEKSPNFDKYKSHQYRYRVSFGYSEDHSVATFRMIKPSTITFENINYNPQCIQALRAAYSQASGICFFTGPTGSGKSTTMAACINTFTRPGELLDNKVFITLEDPIENLFENTRSVKIAQKELYRDFKSFALGIKAALREHPNQIVVGEARDKEVICAAIEAARTGHVTTTTFHASDVAGTVNRIMYHLENDKNLCLDLILQTNIVLSQKMLKQNGQYLVDTQYLLFNNEITKILVDVLDTKDGNVSKAINALIADPRIIQAGWAKDWDYKQLH